MKKRLNIIILMIGLIVLSFCGAVYAEVDGFGNEVVAPGTKSYKVDFANITKGLYFDGNDYYYVLEQGVYATDYLLNLHGDKYYFGEDGRMVKDNIVEFEDEKYYFDPNGTMVKNTWVTHEEVDESDGTMESVTYYFGPTGRAYRAKDRSNNILIKNIDGEKYGFDMNGVRFEGYVSKDGERIEYMDEEVIDQILYYFDPEESYAAASGWIEYLGERSEEYDDGEEMYFYFDEKTGKKVFASEPGKYISRVIDGERYLFNYDGIRQKKWYATPSNVGTPRYYSEDYEGFLAKGWFLAVPQANSVEEKNKEYHRDEEEQWYYAASDGKIVRDTIKKIGSYYYCFDKDGVMQSDCLVVVDGNTFVKSYKLDDVTRAQVVMGADDGGILTNGQKWMYFTEPDEESKIGAMCPLNKNLTLELGDENVTFIANSRGGYGKIETCEPAERNGRYYQNGVLLKPEADSKYGIVRVSKTGTMRKEHYCVVGKSGNRMTKRGALKDENGDFKLVGGISGNYYLGTYNFSKCRLATKNGLPVWEIETSGGREIICNLGNEDTLSDYLIDDSVSYLNFKVWEHAD